MEGLAEDRRLINALVAWTRMRPNRIASEIGVAASTINRHYNGSAASRLSRPIVEKLQDRWPDFPEWQTRNNNIRSEVAEFGDRPFEELLGSGELPAIPVVGSAMAITAFDPERDIELTEVNMAEVLDHVARPAILKRDQEAYALTVIGDSMVPRFKPGRRVIVSPKAKPEIGDDVVLQLRGSEGEGDFRDRVTLVLIKELVRNAPGFVELRQYNPDVTFRVERERIAAMHKVIGEIYRP